MRDTITPFQRDKQQHVSHTEPSHRDISLPPHKVCLYSQKNLKPEGWETFLPQGSDTCMDPIPKAHSNHVLTSSHCHLHPLPTFIVGRYFPHIWLPQLFIQTDLWYWELCTNKIYKENLLLDSYIPKNSEVLLLFFLSHGFTSYRFIQIWKLCLVLVLGLFQSCAFGFIQKNLCLGFKNCSVKTSSYVESEDCSTPRKSTCCYAGPRAQLQVSNSGISI